MVFFGGASRWRVVSLLFVTMVPSGLMRYAIVLVFKISFLHNLFIETPVAIVVRFVVRGECDDSLYTLILTNDEILSTMLE